MSAPINPKNFLWIPAQVAPPNAETAAAARARSDALAKPLGSLGRLEEIGIWVASCQNHCPPQPLDNIRAVILAGDHGVAASGVSAFPAEVTIGMVATMATGRAAMNVLCAENNVPVRVLDISVNTPATTWKDFPGKIAAHKIAQSCPAIDQEDALTPTALAQALATGAQIADEEIAAGAQMLVVGDMGIANTTPAAALIAAHLGLSAAVVTGRGTGIDEEQLLHKTAVIQTALDRAAAHGSLTDGRRRLAALGSPDYAVAVGILIRAASRQVPVILDGVISGAEALTAEAIAPGVLAWCQPGHRSVEPAARLALEHMGKEPILDLNLRLGEGSGAMTAIPVVRQATAILRNMALLSEVMG